MASGKCAFLDLAAGPNDEHSVHEQFLDNIETDGERYQVKLPFKQTHPIIPDNYQISVVNLSSLESMITFLKSKGKPV